MYMSCMVGASNGASMGAEKQFGHVWGGPMVGTASTSYPQNSIFILFGRFFLSCAPCANACAPDSERLL